MTTGKCQKLDLAGATRKEHRTCSLLTCDQAFFFCREQGKVKKEGLITV